MAIKKESQKKIAVGVGVASVAAAAAAAGYYFFGAKNASAHRRKAVAWANSLKKDVVTQAKKLKKLDEKAIKAVVTQASKVYETVKAVEKKEVAAAAKELKAHWREIQKEATGAPKKVARVVKATKQAVAKKASRVIRKK